MSETVHYRGFATKIMQPHGQTVMDVAKSILKEKGCEINEYFKEDASMMVIRSFVIGEIHIDEIESVDPYGADFGHLETLNSSNE